jgi:hypothetical protein
MRIEHWELSIGQIPGLIPSRGCCQAIFARALSIDVLNCPRWRTVRDLVLAGRLPSVKIPCPRSGDGRTIRRVLVDRHDLDAFIEQSKEIAA